MNEIMNNILTRRSIRKFTDAPVSREILDDVVQAALHAPSGCGKQTWKFTVITNKAAIKRLADAIETTLDRPGYNMYCPTAIIMPSNLRDSIWEKRMMPAPLKTFFWLPTPTVSVPYGSTSSRISAILRRSVTS